MNTEQILAAEIAKLKIKMLEIRTLNTELKNRIRELQTYILECPSCGNSFDLLQKEITCPKCKSAKMKRQYSDADIVS